MSRVQTMLVAAFVAFVAMISPGLVRSLCYANAEPSGTEAAKPMPRMHRGFGAEAPWISIALRHRTELSLTEDQVATLEKARTHYQNQSAPVREQLLSVEKEIAGLLQETPANLIQVRLKIEQAEKLRSELRYLRVEALENGKSVLTPQQRDQLKNLVASRLRTFRQRQGQPS
ncbi:MAG TPA: Spy/CpxP family protein refolding chaperone [Candidatus Binatia bacterium]|nr:Spy/CpxP family protein refolding chaperone [Candidatus Binatia bacterium]